MIFQDIGTVLEDLEILETQYVILKLFLIFDSVHDE
jgi:hypothetical protein